MTVFLNRGDGTLGTRRAYFAAPSDSMSIAAADLDGDGSPDLVVTSPGGVSVFRNGGDGTFAPKVDYPIPGDTPVSVAVGDLNGDGKPDVVTGDGGDGPVSVLLNRGDGSLLAARDYDSDGSASVALADLNGDGKLDVAAAGGVGASVLLNAGDGTLERRYAVPSGADESADPQSIAIAELNGDARPDLVTANFDRHVSLLLNGGSRAFKTSIDVATGCRDVFETDRGVAAADLNEDGRADVAVTAEAGLCVALAKPGLCNVQEVRGLKLPAAKALL